MVVRSERPGDMPSIAAVVRDAFGREDEVLLVERLRSEAEYDADLALVAVHDNEIVGHAFFSTACIEQGDKRTEALALAPVAVRPDMQRRGIGSALVRQGLDVCAQQRRGVVIVVGEPAFYGRFGFRPASLAGIQAPFAVPDSVFQALELRPGALQNVRGIVRYSKAFDMLL